LGKGREGQAKMGEGEIGEESVERTGMHEKIATKRNRFGIWGCPLGLPLCVIHVQIVCLCLEPFKSN